MTKTEQRISANLTRLMLLSGRQIRDAIKRGEREAMNEPIPVQEALRLIEMALADCDNATPGEWHESGGQIRSLWDHDGRNLYVLRTVDVERSTVAWVFLARAAMRHMLLHLQERVRIYVSGEFQPGTLFFDPLAALRDHYDRARPDWRTK